MVDELQKFIENNKKYEAKEIQLQKEYKIVQEFNDKFDLDLLKNLPYEDMKKIYTMTRYSFNNEEQYRKLKKIYQEAKLKKYPILRRAHYYPIINDMDFLSDKQKKELDYALKAFEGSYINLDSTRWCDLKFNDQKTYKILEFLYNKKIIKKVYKLRCHCGSAECEDEYITEEEYKKFVEYHSITHEERNKWTKKEWDTYDKNFDVGYFEIPCWNDGGYEICNIKDWNNAPKSICYKNTSKPNCDLDNI